MIEPYKGFRIYGVPTEGHALVQVGSGQREGALLMQFERLDWNGLRPFALLSQAPLSTFMDAHIESIPTDLSEIEVWGRLREVEFGGSTFVFKGASLRAGLVLLMLVVPPATLLTLSSRMMGFQRSDVTELTTCRVEGCANKHSITLPICSQHWSLVPTKEKNEWWLSPIEEREAQLDALWKKFCAPNPLPQPKKRPRALG